MNVAAMNATLQAALVAEGLDQAALDRVQAALDAEYLSVSIHWLTKERLDREREAARRAASHAAGLAAAIPYAGAIGYCQAQVWSSGRGATAHRCHKAARFVVRRKDDHSGHREGPPHRPYDERLAVCRIHAADVQSHRFHRHWSYEHCADWPVEQEYQP